MTVQSKPIPALYVVYILRSTVRQASLYIGSTPHPPRRLNQHNGKAKGGAARTSRNSLRPWEMVGVVSGFPSMVGALKFEYAPSFCVPNTGLNPASSASEANLRRFLRWALNNPHLSLHISPEDRLSFSTQRKRNGQPKRPMHTIASILSNVHLLLRVPSFARWPLTLHMFDQGVHARWEKYLAGTGVEPLQKTLEVVTDFKPAAVVGAEARQKEAAERAASDSVDKESDEEAKGDEEEPEGPKWGIHTLPLDYAPLAPYLEKGQNVTTFEREGNCVVCLQHLEHGKGLFAICPNGECEGMGHLDCWSRHLLHQQGDSDGNVLPLEGRCPKCDGAVRWGDMMKEMTLRVRGQKEVDKVLKKSRRAAGLTKAKAKTKGKAKAKADAQT
ncbi:GIY-YIG catalytic domain-containing protein [Diaporthe amygdali]|uniref:GIY-YIG catalytic domain-containing protein n=1 Tax=Phomopsis amygdali TaxID=1214568 RepID=UPI0022FE6FA2|nr:GIY-YIG catalytic domain-containing protein [Diaporthe amygdali]KAJ0116995.1 GIY-YIG catalytic domain-containing protein [Diaporthe amygdali]